MENKEDDYRLPMGVEGPPEFKQLIDELTETIDKNMNMVKEIVKYSAKIKPWGKGDNIPRLRNYEEKRFINENTIFGKLQKQHKALKDTNNELENICDFFNHLVGLDGIV